MGIGKLPRVGSLLMASKTKINVDRAGFPGVVGGSSAMAPAPNSEISRPRLNGSSRCSFSDAPLRLPCRATML